MNGLHRIVLTTILALFSGLALLRADESERLVSLFEATGDVHYLIQLWEPTLHADLSKNPNALKEHKILLVPEVRAALALRVLDDIDARRAEQEKSRVKDDIQAFIDEMRRRTDQPFINPGTTKPEEIPDPTYRQHYSEHLADMKVSAKLAEARTIFYQLEEEYRSDAIRWINALSDDQKKRLLEQTAADHLSPELRKLLEKETGLSFAPHEKNPAANAR